MRKSSKNLKKLIKCENKFGDFQKGSRVSKNQFMDFKTQVHTFEENNYKFGKRKKKTVRYHKYVAKYFCENPNNLKEVNHINGLKTDNHPSNLEYVTSSYNKKHAYAKGLRGLEGQVAMVRANKKKCVVIDKKTGVEYSFDSYVEAAKHFKKNPRWISDIIHKANGETKNFIVKSEDL